MNKSFAFEMGAAVVGSLSCEKGTVIGRAEYDHSENAYFIRLLGADGRQSDTWFNESALQSAK